MTSDATVFFCVGATKSGTSWLHRFLSDHPDCALRSIKELHYFDALDNGKIDEEIKRSVRARADLQKKLVGADENRSRNLCRQISDRDDWLTVLREGENESAFLGYLNGANSVSKLIGDMTPAYALLSLARLKQMARLTSDVRFVYLMRDPISRLWSHIRMIAARREDSGVVTRERADRIFERTLAGKEGAITVRGDYKSTIEKLSEAVPATNLMIVFYEDLFDGDAVRRVCEFLGISVIDPDLKRRIHVGQPLEMLEDQRQRARKWLEEQYDFVRENFGAIPNSWQYDLAKVQV